MPEPKGGNLNDVIAQCQQAGRQISVAHHGGEKSLLRLTPEHLRAMHFTVNFRPASAGSEPDSIPGHRFLTLVRLILNAGRPAPATSGTPKTYRGTNYAGKFGFGTMVAACQQHGDEIMIGFDGGRSGFHATPAERLKVRDYKFDWTAGPTGRKTPSNWFTGTQFLALLIERRLVDR